MAPSRYQAGVARAALSLRAVRGGRQCAPASAHVPIPDGCPDRERPVQDHPEPSNPMGFHGPGWGQFTPHSYPQENRSRIRPEFGVFQVVLSSTVSQKIHILSHQISTKAPLNTMCNPCRPMNVHVGGVGERRLRVVEWVTGASASPARGSGGPQSSVPGPRVERGGLEGTGVGACRIPREARSPCGWRRHRGRGACRPVRNQRLSHRL